MIDFTTLTSLETETNVMAALVELIGSSPLVMNALPPKVGVGLVDQWQRLEALLDELLGKLREENRK